MSSKKRSPAWWQLYVGLPFLCALYVPELRLRIGSTGHIVLQLGILGLIFAFLQYWLHSNRRAFMEMDADAMEQQGGVTMRVYQFPPADMTRSPRGMTVAQRRIYLPEGELKGVLGTTFEMDCPDEVVYMESREAAAPKEERRG